MNVTFWHSISIIIVVSLCTIIIRSLPFLIFGRKKEVPSVVRYLGDCLPPSIMATLVIYCLKSIQVFPVQEFRLNGLYDILAVIIVIILHLWKKNVILSVGLGTILYMLLIRF